MPTFVSLSTGSLQVTHTAGFNLSVPFTHAISGGTVSIASDQFNLTPAQAADEAQYTTIFVEDPDDLRRLRALLRYALCPDFGELRHEWIAAAGQGGLNKMVADAFRDAESKNQAAYTRKKPAQGKEGQNPPSAKRTLEDANKLVRQLAPENAGKMSPTDSLLLAQKLRQAAEANVKAENAAPKKKIGAGTGAATTNGQASNVDTVENEARHLSYIVDAFPPKQNWIWVIRQGGPPAMKCSYGTSFANADAVLIGTFNGITFYADPDKLGLFFVLLNYAVPNTIGTTFLGDQGTLVGQGPRKVQTLQLIGSP